MKATTTVVAMVGVIVLIGSTVVMAGKPDNGSSAGDLNSADGKIGPVKPKGEIGLIYANVDSRACPAPHPACEGFPPEAPAPSNSNPIRIIVQVSTIQPDSTFDRGDFEVRTPFAPEGAAPVEVVDCPACFEIRDGGTYGLWLAPRGGTWSAGAYFFTIGLRDEPGILEALARFDMPAGPPPPQPSSCDDNQVPIARIAGPDTITLVGSFGQQINLLLDGTLSSDPEGRPLDEYNWQCGNNFVAQGQPPNGARAVCGYRVDGAPVTYTATLVVEDRGTGEIDPETGGYACQKSSPEDRITVLVRASTAP